MPSARIELTASSLLVTRSTTELRRHDWLCSMKENLIGPNLFSIWLWALTIAHNHATIAFPYLCAPHWEYLAGCCKRKNFVVGLPASTTNSTKSSPTNESLPLHSLGPLLNFFARTKGGKTQVMLVQQRDHLIAYSTPAPRRTEGISVATPM